jgi:hypothetical protein
VSKKCTEIGSEAWPVDLIRPPWRFWRFFGMLKVVNVISIG